MSAAESTRAAAEERESGSWEQDVPEGAAAGAQAEAEEQGKPSTTDPMVS